MALQSWVYSLKRIGLRVQSGGTPELGMIVEDEEVSDSQTKEGFQVTVSAVC